MKKTQAGRCWPCGRMPYVPLSLYKASSLIRPIQQYGHSNGASASDAKVGPVVDSAKAQAASQTLRDCPEIDAGQVGRMVQAWRESGCLD